MPTRSQRVVGQLRVARRWRAEKTEVRRATHAHDFDDRERKRRRVLLEDEADAPRDGVDRHARQVDTIQQHAPALRVERATQTAQERGLAAAVRSEQTQQLTGRDLQTQIAEDRPARSS